MNALITCPICEGTMQIDASYSGKQVQCPHCKNAVTVPRLSAAATATPPAKGFICPSCGTLGEPKVVTPGSLLVEIALWLLLLIPGFIYSMWRLIARRKGCRQCGEKVLSLGTPRGQSLWREYHSQA